MLGETSLGAVVAVKVINRHRKGVGEMASGMARAGTMCWYARVSATKKVDVLWLLHTLHRAAVVV